VGVVTPDPACERFRGLLAERAVGRPSPDEATELDAHLAGCAGCRSDAVEVARAAGALAWISPAVADELVHSGGTGDDVAPTVALDAAVAGILSGGPPSPAAGPTPTGDGRTRRQRVLAPLVAVAAAALLVSAGVAASGHGSPVTRTVELAGPSGARATAVLTAEAWGTSVTVTDPAGRADQVLSVAMTTEYGHRWDVGSYRVTTSHGATVTVACALPVDQIRTIDVTDATGHVVLAGHQPEGAAET
jgi:hypothetical protein